MHRIALMACGLMGCVGKGTSPDPDSGTDSGGDDTAETEACEEHSFLFNTGTIDQLPECFSDLTDEVDRLFPNTDFSDTGTTATLDTSQMGQALLSALHGQLNGALQALKGKGSADTYEAVCERYADALGNQPPPHGDDTEEVCENAEKWASNVNLNAYFSCETAYLSEAMSVVLTQLTGIDATEAFWARIYSDIGTNPNLIWLPMYLAMQHGGSPAVLFYTLPVPTTGGESHGNVAILELGMEVHGAPDQVAEFWAFIDGSFDQKAYNGKKPTDWSQLDIILPSRLTWRDGNTVSTWVLGDVIPEPFDQNFSTATGIIDPCTSDRKDNEGFSAGGAGGECSNSFERMMAAVHELQGIQSFTGTVAATCDRTAYDYTL